ncbi:MAG TPA: hypothetical protein VGX50_05955, partial [Longimicrobium sp.]|nr:hypothetical protein [Longimicrobium sp.]
VETTLLTLLTLCETEFFCRIWYKEASHASHPITRSLHHASSITPKLQSRPDPELVHFLPLSSPRRGFHALEREREINAGA